MTNQPDQTPVPDKGQKQGDPPPSTPPSDLEKRLVDLQTQLTTKDAEIKTKDAEIKKKDTEARRLQAAADQRASLLDRIKQNNQPPAPPGRVPSPSPSGQPPVGNPQADLLEFADAQAKEALMLRAVISRGLKLDDVEGIIFNTAQELNTQLDLIQQKKEIDELRSQLSKNKEGTPPGEPPAVPPSAPKIDTGGRSAPVAPEQLVELQETRKRASELKGQGKFQEATWLALKAARRDPNNVSLVKPEEEE